MNSESQSKESMVQSAECLVRGVDAFLRELESTTDSQVRFARLVERARVMAPLEFEARVDSNRVSGCLVRLWWVPEWREGRCWFRCDSDAVSLKALVGLLCEYYSGQTAGWILSHPPEFLNRLRLLRTLAENRRRTVLSVWGLIERFATLRAERNVGGINTAQGCGSSLESNQAGGEHDTI